MFLPNSLRRICLRSPRGSDSPPDCHSPPARPFAQRFRVLLSTSELFALRAHNPRTGALSLFTNKTKKAVRLDCFFVLVAEMGFEPHDLRVMSPTSYRTALLRDIGSLGAGDRDRTGTMLSHHGILSPGRLPVPPHRQVTPRDLRPFGSHCLL